MCYCCKTMCVRVFLAIVTVLFIVSKSSHFILQLASYTFKSYFLTKIIITSSFVQVPAIIVYIIGAKAKSDLGWLESSDGGKLLQSIIIGVIFALASLAIVVGLFGLLTARCNRKCCTCCVSGKRYFICQHTYFILQYSILLFLAGIIFVIVGAALIFLGCKFEIAVSYFQRSFQPFCLMLAMDTLSLALAAQLFQTQLVEIVQSEQIRQLICARRHALALIPRISTPGMRPILTNTAEQSQLKSAMFLSTRQRLGLHTASLSTATTLLIRHTQPQAKALISTPYLPIYRL